MKDTSESTTMMSRISSPDHHYTFLTSKSSHEPITASFCKTWKLYDNPSYSHSHPHPQRKALIWDLNFVKAFMESQLEAARTQILELKTQLDYERKARKRAETLNKILSKDLKDERRGREAVEMEYKRLFNDSSSEKSEIHRLKREIEEERKMHRLAEVLREERVQMKLADARLCLEEKLSELEKTKPAESMKQSKQENPDTQETAKQNKSKEERSKTLARVSSSPAYLSGEERRTWDVSNENEGSPAIEQRRSWRERENPHIKRGIMGLVEFPRVMRAIRSKGGDWGWKMEGERQKTAPRCSSLFSSG